MQVGDLDTGVHAQRGIEIRERFVEQEQFRFAHDGAPDGHPLTLPARKLERVAIQIGSQIKHPAGFGHAVLDDGFGLAFLFQASVMLPRTVRWG